MNFNIPNLKALNSLKNYFGKSKEIKFKTIFKEFKNSKNKIYVLEKYKSYILPRFLLLGFVFAFIGFFIIDRHHILDSFTSSLQMLAFNLPSDYNSYNILFPISSILIAFVLFYAAITTFFSQAINNIILSNIRKQNHMVIFGLKDINRSFLNSNDYLGQTIIIDTQNEQNLDLYKSKGYAVVNQDLINVKLNPKHYSNMNRAIIALGDDKTNIDFTIKLINALATLENPISKRVIIHIVNDEMKEVFNQKVLDFETLSRAKIDIKTFSYFEECSNDLLEKYSFIDNEKIKEDKIIKSVILGDGDLATKIIKDILILSNLPKKNLHKIYILDRFANEFFEKLKLKTFYTREKFPSVEIILINKSFKRLEYFKEGILQDRELDNVYVIYDDENINLNLAIELNDKVFIKKNKLPKLYLALYNNYHFLKDGKFLENFIVFGREEEILSKERILDEKNYKIAKLVHNGYGDEFKRDNLVLDESSLDKKWFNTKNFSDKLSSIAQAKHLNIKLQALGLKKVPSNENKEELLKENIKIFDEMMIPLLKQADTSYEDIHKASLELEKVWSGESYEVKYLPKDYKTLFEQLIESEHERWNAYHFVNGWDFSDKKDKFAKLHNCLKPISEFKEKDLQITILYDIYATLYIPNYLASAGYKLEKINNY